MNSIKCEQRISPLRGRNEKGMRKISADGDDTLYKCFSSNHLMSTYCALSPGDPRGPIQSLPTRPYTGSILTVLVV